MAQAVLPSAVYNDTLKGVAQPESALPKPFARNVSECKETMASSLQRQFKEDLACLAVPGHSVFAPAWSRQLHPAKNTVLLGAVNQGLQGEGLGISVELQDLATCRARKAQCNNSSIGGIPVNLRVILLGMHHVVDESLYRY